MHQIEIYVAPISKTIEVARILLGQEFGLNSENTAALKMLQKRILLLKSTLYAVFETQYVDKVYRDSYYHYYSSKRKNYPRNCIRLSFFEGKIDENDFQDPVKHSIIRENYRGFMVLRPTIPMIIGRTFLSPKAYKENNIKICHTEIESTSCGLKVSTEGFPYSSQDTETITCAETTLWAIMEYFSSKYSDYSPILPSKIIAVLKRISTERQTPSRGLEIPKISFTLKKLGFGVKVYSQSQYGDELFNNLLSCYVESGIPLIIVLTNRPKGGIGHANICIGYETVKDSDIDSLKPISHLNRGIQEIVDSNSLQIYDWGDVKRNFVFIDDNCPVYQKATLDAPAIHYSEKWHDCMIKQFIAPLHTKIYLDAAEARSYLFELILRYESIEIPEDLMIRFYLASSRSYKNYVISNSSFDPIVKDSILKSPMAKFIWVTELSSKSDIKAKKAKGLILLDATEPNVRDHKALILALYNGKSISYNDERKELSRFPLPLQPFIIYESNLKAL